VTFHHSGVWVAQVLCALLLSVLFLQSGLDKVLDWKGNRAYIASVFEKTPLRRLSGLMLLSITALEVLAGAISGAGVLGLLILQDPTTAFVGASLSGLTIVCLFFGQRIAKDYAGAAGLVPYFLACVTAVLVTTLR
jgi:uncharacterized membrane protein YphA (DoxX/SURF4 family)